jgi:hypothetical protein
MAFKTFAPGVLTSSDVNTFLMRQAVITCTSSTRPASPNEGMTIYETDTDQVLTYSGSAWESGYMIGAYRSFTPTVSVGTIGNGTVTSQYAKFGRLVNYRGTLTYGSTTQHPELDNWRFSLPVSKGAGDIYGTGTGLYLDVSAASIFGCYSFLGAGQVVNVALMGTSVFVSEPRFVSSYWQQSTNKPVAAGTGDIVSWDIVYEAAA